MKKTNNSEIIIKEIRTILSCTLLLMFVLSIWGCQNAEFELLKRKEGKKEGGRKRGRERERKAGK